MEEKNVSLTSLPIGCKYSGNGCAHLDNLENVYKHHFFLEWVVEGIYPFFFFLTIVGYVTKELQNYKVVFSVLCVYSYFLAYRIPLSLTPTSANTLMSRCQNNYFAAFTLSVEIISQLLLVTLTASLLEFLLRPPSDTLLFRKEMNKNVLIGVVLSVSLTFASLTVLCKKKKKNLAPQK